MAIHKTPNKPNGIGLPRSVESILRSRLSRFLAEPAPWKEPLQKMVAMLRDCGWQAVIFGGVLRDLVLYGPAERPRDVDVVVNCSSEELSAWLAAWPYQRTRFGGFRVRVYKWNFDMWSLSDTWAFKAGYMAPTFENLPKTTFFNIEGIAAELNTARRHKRTLYSFGFSDAISSRTLDINFEPNPFPQLCVIRGLLTAARHNLFVSERLARYMVSRGSRSEIAKIVDAQFKHYGLVRLRARDIVRWLDHLDTCLNASSHEPVKLPITAPEQLELPILGEVDILQWHRPASDTRSSARKSPEREHSMKHKSEVKQFSFGPEFRLSRKIKVR